MNLSDLQEQFANHIYNQNNLKIFSKINSSKIDIRQRMDIYRNNIFSSFDDSLSLTYESTKNIVGDDYFYKIIKQYHHKYHSKSGNLEDYGQYFPKFIKSLEKEHKLPYLTDLANLEWFYNLSYFSKDAKPIDIKKLQSLSEDDFMSLYFNLHPSCYLIASKYPIYSIWSKDKINLEEKKGQFIIIEGSSFKVNIHNLAKAEYGFLKMIEEKKNIYQIHETLSLNKEDFDIGSLINKFVSCKIITNFNVKND